MSVLSVMLKPNSRKKNVRIRKADSAVMLAQLVQLVGQPLGAEPPLQARPTQNLVGVVHGQPEHQHQHQRRQVQLFGHAVEQHQEGQNQEKLDVQPNPVEQKRQRRRAQHRHHQHRHHVAPERDDRDALREIVLQGKVEEHDAQDVGKRAFVHDELLLFARQAGHAGNGNGRADNGQRHGIHEAALEVDMQPEVQNQRNDHRLHHQHQHRRQKGAADQRGFFAGHLQVQRAFQHNHNQADDAEYFQNHLAECSA